LAEVGSGGQTGFMASMSICSRGCRGWGDGSCPNVLLARFAEGEFPRKKTERPNRSLVSPTDLLHYQKCGGVGDLHHFLLGVFPGNDQARLLSQGICGPAISGVDGSRSGGELIV